MRFRLATPKLFLLVLILTTVTLLILVQYLLKDDVLIYRNYQYFDTSSSSNNTRVPWFLVDGTLYPTNSKRLPKLLPEQDEGDRVIEQLMYVPRFYKGYKAPEKLILSYHGFAVWNDIFSNNRLREFDRCPVDRCVLTNDRDKADKADAIIFKQFFEDPGITRPYKQVWIMFMLESPYHTPRIDPPDLINWTATYRRDSDIPIPYGKWVYYHPMDRLKRQDRNFAASKNKKVIWFVSNCNAHNNRLEYARELGEHIEVDIYGRCGSLKCSRTNEDCFKSIAGNYKFYLSFENSNCEDYITEKLYENAYGYDILPIVMGAKPEVYSQSTPQGSFIHVDDFADPADLAAYLHKLDQDDELYNSYFKWKGTGEFINHYFWCRLCAMLHSSLPHKHYKDINEWWQKPEVCTGDRVKKGFWNWLFS